ncbi:predicted GPI-anchored protein 58 [Onychomys torridus]|uniref:predicted GPI-anchored protein 58 n=1 Tax=Onychomys torridus TaxID=38674 RepID=UPI00167FAA1F|nr:predicted GPI-anchored protein 58 [Onychomys torridus]
MYRNSSLDFQSSHTTHKQPLTPAVPSSTPSGPAARGFGARRNKPWKLAGAPAEAAGRAALAAGDSQETVPGHRDSARASASCSVYPGQQQGSAWRPETPTARITPTSHPREASRSPEPGVLGLTPPSQLPEAPRLDPAVEKERCGSPRASPPPMTARTHHLPAASPTAPAWPAHNTSSAPRRLRGPALDPPRPRPRPIGSAQSRPAERV